MNPDSLVLALIKIANRIDNSISPSRELVVNDLKNLVLKLSNDIEEKTAGYGGRSEDLLDQKRFNLDIINLKKYLRLNEYIDLVILNKSLEEKSMLEFVKAPISKDMDRDSKALYAGMIKDSAINDTLRFLRNNYNRGKTLLSNITELFEKILKSKIESFDPNNLDSLRSAKG